MKQRRFDVVIDPVASAEMQVWGEHALPNETGGVLLGHIVKLSGHTTVRVRAAIEVPDPRATHTGYERNAEAANAALLSFRTNRDPTGRLGYVGDWHTHPCAVPASAADLHTLERAATGRHHPLAMVVACWDGHSWSFDSRVSTGHWFFRRWW